MFGRYFKSADFSGQSQKITAAESMKKMDSITLYFNAVQAYVDEARQHARDYDFDLAQIKYGALGILISSDFDLNLATNPGKKLSLAQTAPNDPTIIDVSGGKARITQGAGSALNLNSTETTVTNLTFTNYTSGDGKTENVALALTVNSSLVGSHEYTESVTVRSTAEVRSN